MLEKTLTKYAKEKMKSNKLWHFKLSDRYHSGLPDFLILKNGRAYFLELKATDNKPTAIQVVTARGIINEGGAGYRWCDSKEKVDDFIMEVVNG